MKCYVVDTLVGIFAFDESGNILNFIDFNDSDQKIIEFYESLENDIIIKEYESFLLDVKNSGFNNFVYDNKKLEVLSSQKLGLETSLVSDSNEIKNFRLNLEDQLKKVGIKKSRFEIFSKI